MAFPGESQLGTSNEASAPQMEVNDTVVLIVEASDPKLDSAHFEITRREDDFCGEIKIVGERQGRLVKAETFEGLLPLLVAAAKAQNIPNAPESLPLSGWTKKEKKMGGRGGVVF